MQRSPAEKSIRFTQYEKKHNVTMSNHMFPLVPYLLHALGNEPKALPRAIAAPAEPAALRASSVHLASLPLREDHGQRER